MEEKKEIRQYIISLLYKDDKTNKEFVFITTGNIYRNLAKYLNGNIELKSLKNKKFIKVIGIHKDIYDNDIIKIIERWRYNKKNIVGNEYIHKVPLLADINIPLCNCGSLTEFFEGKYRCYIKSLSDLEQFLIDNKLYLGKGCDFFADIDIPKY